MRAREQRTRPVESNWPRGTGTASTAPSWDVSRAFSATVESHARQASGETALEHALGRVKRLGSNLLLDHFAILEDDEKRNRGDRVLRRGFRVFLRVQLRHLDLAVELVGELIDDRRHRDARSAPRGPEIDEDDPAVLQHLGVEGIRLSKRGC